MGGICGGQSPIVSELQTETEDEVVQVAVKTAMKNMNGWKTERQQAEDDDDEVTVIWTQTR